jgi:hypothetical protein
MEWRQRIRNVESVITFDVADTFVRFLEAVTAAVANGDRERFHGDLMADAACRARIAQALATQ